ncbi:hypothetical protein FRC17_000852 [Serendipita sp. 399]|nr:hypothetical protein FRC17_000852 [Serendipita sp. 399]
MSQEESKPNKVTICRFTPDPALFCSAPFCNKLDALLTFSGVKGVQYEGVSPMGAPRRLLPYAKIDGVIVPDSELIYETLKDKGVIECLDSKAALSPQESALTYAIKALVEKSLVEFMVYERWIENHNLTADTFLSDVPWIFRRVMGYFFVWRPYQERFWGSGLTRYTPEERERDLKANLRALATLVPSSGYIHGKSAPTRVDAIVFGFLTAVYRFPQLCPKVAAGLAVYPHFLEYHHQLSVKFWPQRKPVV